MKSLKDKYNQLFSGKPKSNDGKLLTEGTWMAGVTTGKPTKKRMSEADAGTDRKKDFQTMLQEITDMLGELTDEFGYELEMTADVEGGVAEYRQWLTQLGRYSEAAEKNLKGIGKIIKQAYGGL
jgi:hypothetical protein